ncbi:MAG: transposase, partial [Candidatus Aenigmarchaeota archaeon]|nr:transposase [Candidatus Aenigmarchaeota archaeon]
YISFIEIALQIASLIPPYSSKFSKKTYTQQQLLVLLILKQKLKLSYETLIEDLKTRPNIILLIGLTKLPSPSTLKMFTKRIKSSLLEKLIGKTISFTKKKKLKLGVDATGFHIEDGSFYYRKRVGLSSKTRKNVKLSAAIETDKQLVIATKIRKSTAHDNIDFKPLVKKASKIKQIKIVVSDKGYDDERNHKFVVEKLKAECIIPPRDYGERTKHNAYSYRNKLKKKYSKKKYHQKEAKWKQYFL